MSKINHVAVKNFLKGFTAMSIFDPDLSSDNDKEEIKTFTLKQIWNHATGKERLSIQDLEQLKKQAKYAGFL